MRVLAILLLAVAAVPARAQDAPEVTAPPPVDRAVTIYRAPGRNGGGMALDRLGGFAVITETRNVTLPAGAARLRFGGVADGIVPESVIIVGLPGSVIEKNRDAALLSPSALMRAAVGRTVTLRRTDRKTGKVSEVPARLVSASNNGVVFATAGGNEALQCSGLPETFAFSGGAEGLSAQPTLSVRTRSPAPVHAQVRLTYIAENFDWAANYIARLSADGRTADLSGWITLANGNGVSWPGAQVQIVAGGLNRAYVRRFINEAPQVIARCWPMQTTSDIPEVEGRPYALVRPWTDADTDEIIVTAMRRPAPPVVAPPPPLMVMAAPAAIATAPQAEQLGDLKLYRVPERTTVAAYQMKQTRLIDQPGVPVETVYRVDALLAPWQASAPATAATILLRTRNDKAHHLGLPLPAGAVLVQQVQAGRIMVLSEPSLRDTAEDEKVELALGSAADVTCAWTRAPLDDADPRTRHIVATLSNAMPGAAAVEFRLMAAGGWSIDRTSVEMPKIDGVPTLSLILAQGESRQIELTLRRE